MKALIFNSGLGSRLGDLTSDRPKSMVRLGNGETIFHRQLRVLHACGVDEFVVTTGPYPEQLAAEAAPFEEDGCTVSFVPNPVYSETNYIYSMWLARDLLREDDFLMLHGDLVFDAAYAQMVVDSELPSLGSVNASLPQPEKDFKARIADGEVREVSVKIFDEDCIAFQPFYKLSAAAMGTWLDAIDRFVEAGETGVYAENAANEVFGRMGVAAFSYEGHFVEEVDTPEDLARVSAGIRLLDFAQQPVYRAVGDAVELADGFAPGASGRAGSVAEVLASLGMHHPLVVASKHFRDFAVARRLEEADADYELFCDFSPNPTYEDAARALAAFRLAGCDSLLSIGGGSAIDVAKCVKQLLAMPKEADGESLKSKDLPYSGVPHVAVPTTAGTGSESTHFAVCYVDGAKASVANDCLLPDAVLLDASNLAGLPDYQKKCTMLDALCQAIESYWSARSSEESRAYSATAIPAIIANADAYLAGDADAARSVMQAANRAGKAINLTTTTAPHAMSYKLTSLYGVPHGHAVAMCMPHCWRILLERGDSAVQARLVEVASLMKGDSCTKPEAGLVAFEEFFDGLGLDATVSGTMGDVDVLVSSVNLQRLSNFPIDLSREEIEMVYKQLVL